VQLKLMVHSPDGPNTGVVVECRADAPAHEVLDALAGHLGLSPGSIAAGRCERSGDWLAGNAPVGEADLRDGDLLHLTGGAAPTVAARTVPAPAVIDLVVMGGPDSGRRVALAAGDHVVGRGPGADVVLSDRSMSRRHVRVGVSADGITVADAGSRNGSFVSEQPLTAERRLAPGEMLEAGRSLLTFQEHSEEADARPDGRLIAFNRPPRVARPAPQRKWSLDVPKAAPPGGGLSPVLLLPVVAGIVLFLVTGRAYTLLFALLAPAMAVASTSESSRAGRRRHAQEADEFHAKLDTLATELEAARAEESERRRAGAPDAAELRMRAERPMASLWERRPSDDDFLALRVGTADLAPQARVELSEDGDPELRAEATQRLRPAATLSAVPVVVPLDGGAIGIVGPAARIDGIARWLLVQAAVLHSPRDLEIVAVVAAEKRAQWRWLRWLPHVSADGIAAGAAGLRPRASGDDAPARLVLADGTSGLSPTLAEEIMDRRTAIVWLAERVVDLPAACTAIAELEPAMDRLKVTDVGAGATIDDVAADGVAADWAEELARLLAPVRDTGARDEAGSVPARVSLLELLGIPDPTPAAVAERWSGDQENVAAPIGMAADGPLELDINRVEGLRMLLAGMPGAGKSELLQAFIAALALTYPPTRLAFLLVDYKGGAAFRDCVDLPHTAALITDLDAGLTERARISLLAELRRREALLQAAGARNLRELVARRPDDAPPALVIVVDEFATLARELPGFVDTVVDVAQRGRSLGLHLVLATQRPRGAVNDVIRANTNLRIAMRVADAGESHDVIESPDAAAIPAGLPGRAIALAGRHADGSPQLKTFQAGYAGGTTAGILDAAMVTVRSLDGDENGGAPGPQVLSAIGGTRPTDLQAVVTATREAATRLQLAGPPAPWLPPLPGRLALSDLPAARAGHVVAGLVDDPARQLQEPLDIDLEKEGSVLIYGASGSGKTALLRSLACSLADAHTPRQLEIYGLDFGSRGLLPLEDLPHCGSVIGADDPERVVRLVRMLGRALDARRSQVADGGSRPGERGLPRIVLLLDGYANFAAAFERVDFGAAVQTIGRLAADGRALGLHVVMTADRRADVPGSLAGTVQSRIVLRMASDDEYAALGFPRARNSERDVPPGRGFVADGREFQAAFVGAEEISGLAQRLRSEHPGLVAQPIGRLPTQLQRSALPVPSGPLRAVIGVDDAMLAAAELDLSESHAVIAGPHRSGMSTALATIAQSLRRGDPGLSLYLLASRRSPLHELGLWAAAAVGPEQCAELAGRLAAGNEHPLVAIIDDGMDLAEGAAAAAIESLLARGRDEPVRVVAAVDLHGAQRVFGGWVRELRAERTGLLLQPHGDGDGDLLGVSIPAQRGGPMPPGRGYLAERGVARLVQIAGA
jgi:DNA segregation ATPase FtsK/SpoIIIE, S-DNA-T family